MVVEKREVQRRRESGEVGRKEGAESEAEGREGSVAAEVAAAAIAGGLSPPALAPSESLRCSQWDCDCAARVLVAFRMEQTTRAISKSVGKKRGGYSGWPVDGDGSMEKSRSRRHSSRCMSLLVSTRTCLHTSYPTLPSSLLPATAPQCRPSRDSNGALCRGHASRLQRQRRMNQPRCSSSSSRRSAFSRSAGTLVTDALACIWQLVGSSLSASPHRDWLSGGLGRDEPTVEAIAASPSSPRSARTRKRDWLRIRP